MATERSSRMSSSSSSSSSSSAAAVAAVSARAASSLYRNKPYLRSNLMFLLLSIALALIAVLNLMAIHFSPAAYGGGDGDGDGDGDGVDLYRHLPPPVEHAAENLRLRFLRIGIPSLLNLSSSSHLEPEEDREQTNQQPPSRQGQGRQGQGQGRRQRQGPRPLWSVGLAKCRYEGNCPRGTTCVWSTNDATTAPGTSSTEEEGGVCQPYLPMPGETSNDIAAAGVGVGVQASTKHGAAIDARSDENQDLERCAERCRQDVVLDERFYFKASVSFVGMPIRASPSRGRPSGCVLRYRRSFKSYKDDVPVQEWRDKRSGSIVRIDPSVDTSYPSVAYGYDPSRGKEVVWEALCYDPCRDDADCFTNEEDDQEKDELDLDLDLDLDLEEEKEEVTADGRQNSRDIRPQAFACHREKGTCQKRRRRWIPENSDGFSDMVILTGANSGYYSGLHNLVSSLLYWSPRNRVVVYNLGMKPSQLRAIRTWPNVLSIEWQDGGLAALPGAIITPDSYHSRFPPHVSNVKNFAWKLLAIDSALRRYNKTLWIDAGSTVTAPIDPLERIIEQTGSLLMWGQDDDMTTWSMRLTYERSFNATKESYKGYPHYAGTYMGFLRPSVHADSVLKPAVLCASVRECIDMPEKRMKGDSGGHRYDQTVLSIAAYRPDVMPKHHTEYMTSSRSDLNRNLSLPSEKILFSSRKGCHSYSDLMGLSGGEKWWKTKSGG